jgi:hypothetical protein
MTSMDFFYITLFIIVSSYAVVTHHGHSFSENGYRDPMEIYRFSYTGLVLLLLRRAFESSFDKSYYVSPLLYGHSLLQNPVTV